MRFQDDPTRSTTPLPPPDRRGGMVRRILFGLLALVIVALIPLLHGMVQVAKYEQGKSPKRLAFRAEQMALCLGGATAKPDVRYCETMIDSRLNCTVNLLQDALAESFIPGIPNSLCPPPDAMQEILIRAGAERSAMLFGADGSTRFSGNCEREYRAISFEYECREARQTYELWRDDYPDAAQAMKTRVDACDRGFDAVWADEHGMRERLGRNRVCTAPYGGWKL